MPGFDGKVTSLVLVFPLVVAEAGWERLPNSNQPPRKSNFCRGSGVGVIPV